MKNKTKLIAALAITAASTHASVLTGVTGTTADGIGYSISGNPTFLADGGIETATNGGGTVVFTFDSNVNFTISPTTDNINGRVVFDGSGNNNIFSSSSANGTWIYTAGAFSVPTITSGSLFGVPTTTIATGDSTGLGTDASGNVSYNDDWGQISITGTNEVTWTYTNQTNFEAFTFDAVGVPEPSSAALLGLGGLALLARRRR